MGLFKVIFSIIGFVILAVVGLGAYLYFTDYEAQATVTEKGQDADGHYVVITPRFIPYDVRQPLTSEQASFVCEGYRVTYRVQTGYYQVFDDRDVLVYDSEKGLQNTAAAIRCGAANTGGGGILG